MPGGENLLVAQDCGFVGSGGSLVRFWISNLFTISILGFRISCLVAAAGRHVNAGRDCVMECSLIALPRRYGGRPLGCCLLLSAVLLVSCGQEPSGSTAAVAQPDTQLAAHGTVQVTAQLVEVPEGAIFKKDLYNYATILKYEVLQVHRGEVQGDTIYVGHYNPWLPRSEAVDKRVQEIGGNLERFEAGQIHHLSLEVPIDDFFMGGIVNKYFGQETGPLYWAVWTNLAKD